MPLFTSAKKLQSVRVTGEITLQQKLELKQATTRVWNFFYPFSEHLRCLNYVNILNSTSFVILCFHSNFVGKLTR